MGYVVWDYIYISQLSSLSHQLSALVLSSPLSICNYIIYHNFVQFLFMSTNFSSIPSNHMKFPNTLAKILDSWSPVSSNSWSSVDFGVISGTMSNITKPSWMVRSMSDLAYDRGWSTRVRIHIYTHLNRLTLPADHIYITRWKMTTNGKKREGPYSRNWCIAIYQWRRRRTRWRQRGASRCTWARRSNGSWSRLNTLITRCSRCCLRMRKWNMGSGMRALCSFLARSIFSAECWLR